MTFQTKPWMPPITLLLLLAFGPNPLSALIDTPQRVAFPPAESQERGISPDDFVRLGDRLYFSAWDELHGGELWVSDGTTPGTHLVADLCPGRCSSNVQSLELLGHKVLFVATDGFGWLLYSLVGDELAVVARLPGEVVDTEIFGSKLYVAVEGPLADYRLYQTEGTSASWRLFEDLCTEPTPPYCSDPELFVHQDALYYQRQGALRKLSSSGQATTLRGLQAADDFEPLSDQLFLFRGCGDDLAGSCRLMRSDGTPQGTVPVNADAADRNTEDPNGLIAWNGAVYYWGLDNNLFRSDGTVTGTGLSVVPGPTDSIVAVDPNKLFYRSRTAQGATELHALFTDGHREDLLTGEASQGYIGRLGGHHLFALAGQRFFWTDGTAVGSRMLDGWKDTGFSLAAELGGALYVSANRDADYAGDLWRFDVFGNATLVVGSRPFHEGEGPYPHTLGNSALLASTVDEGLFRIDPATLLVEPVAGVPLRYGPVSGDVMLASTTETPPSLLAVRPTATEDIGIAGYRDFVSAGDGLFYFSYGPPGQRLWQTDGTAAGTREVLDLYPGWEKPGCSFKCVPDYPSSITVSGNNVFFVGGIEPGSEELALHAYDRSTGERRVLRAVPGQNELDMVPFGDNKVAFYLDRLTDDDRGVWVSDGSREGTRRVFAMSLREGLDPLQFLAPVGERVPFSTGTTYSPPRLWASDTQPNGTHVLLSGDQLGLGPSVAVGDQLFFVASTLEQGTELWLTDGTPAGTRVIDIRPGPASSLPNFLTRVGDRVVFAADDGVRGYEVFLSDGTAAGTFPLTDLAAGKTPSSPGSFAAVGERIFFTANDGQSGRALWALDPPPAGLSPCPAEKLCLQGGRFEVEVQAQVGANGFVGRRVQSSAESGVFTFFSANNWELMVKVLDGCALNQAYWVYAAAATDVAYELTVTDRASGERKSYQSPAGTSQPILDSAAFATCGEGAPEPAYTPILPVAGASPRCSDEPGAFCFGQGNRFEARVTWDTGEQQGVGHAEPYGSQDSGIFSFFSPANWELMLKVLDGCAINGKFWVYLAGSTDVGWTLTLEDRQTGQVRTYQNPLGNASPAIADGMAFGCS